MSSFKDIYPDGVREFTHGLLQWSVNFPAKYVCCEMCNFIMYERNNGGYSCGVTHEKIYEKSRGVPQSCPLVLIDTDEIMEEN